MGRSPSVGSSAHIDDEKIASEDGRQVVDDAELRKRFPTISERRLLAKIDLRLVPVLCILYLLAFLDRSVPILQPSRHDALTHCKTELTFPMRLCLV